METLQFTHDHLETKKYQEKHLLKIDSIWSELMVPIITTYNNLYKIVSEYEGTLDKLTCRFYRLSSSGISNEDYINKYIKTEETKNKFFFEIDLTSEETKRSGIISAIYYMTKFNSLLTITEGSQPKNMAPYVLIASLDKVYDKEYLSTLTAAQLKVNFGATANTHYNNWKNSWNLDSKGIKTWTNKNRYPLYLFTDANLLEIDNILKDKFVTLFSSTGMTNVQIYNLLGSR